MKKESPEQSTAAQKFWDAFKACAEDNRVRPNRSPFYVKWVQAFVNFCEMCRPDTHALQIAFVFQIGCTFNSSL